MIVQSHGLGHLESNAVLLGWSRTASGQALQMSLARDFVTLGKSVLFLNYDQKRGFGNRRIINVWWQGRGGNEDLMMILVHLIEEHPSWKRVKVRLLRVVNSQAAIADTLEHMRAVLSNARIQAEPSVIIRDQPDVSISEIIHRHSLDADLTIIGMHLPTPEEDVTYSQRLNALIEAVGTVLIVRNALLDEDLLSSG